MNQILAILTGAALSFALGTWAGIEWQQGRQAQTEAAARDDRDASRALTFGREAVRLDAETAADLTLGAITDEARLDPDADLPALGLRAAQRLNRIP